MKKQFLLIGACFLNIVSLSAREEFVWKHTSPTAEDIEASKPKAIDLALQKGDLSWVKNFVQQGGDVNAYVSFGMNMLARAVFFDHMHIVQYLVETGGADVNRRSDYVVRGDERGNTPLMLAAQSNNLAMVTYLVKHGADITILNDLKTCNEETVVQWVRQYGSRQMREYFETICPTQDNDDEDDN